MKNRDSDFCQETQNWSKRYTGVVNKYPIMDIEERLRAVEKRLLLVAPPDDMLAKYPALKEAYENYKIVEKLTLEKNET